MSALTYAVIMITRQLTCRHELLEMFWRVPSQEMQLFIYSLISSGEGIRWGFKQLLFEALPALTVSC